MGLALVEGLHVKTTQLAICGEVKVPRSTDLSLPPNQPLMVLAFLRLLVRPQKRDLQETMPPRTSKQLRKGFASPRSQSFTFKTFIID